jgi:hypothetical protein
VPESELEIDDAAPSDPPLSFEGSGCVVVVASTGPVESPDVPPSSSTIGAVPGVEHPEAAMGVQRLNER